MRQILTLFSFLILQLAYAQKEDILKKNSNYLKKDTLKCNLLNSIIEEEDNHLIWIKYNNELKVICGQKINQKTKPNYKTYLKYYSIALLNEGVFYNYTDRYNLAIQYYKKSFEVAKRIKFNEQSASSLQNIGTAFDYLGKIDSSLMYFKKALIYAELSKNKSNIAYVLTDLGFVYNNTENTTLAIEYNIKALKLFEELKDTEGIERTYLALGRIFDGQKEFNKSIQYYKKGLKIAYQNNQKHRQCLILNSLANSYIQIGNNNIALTYAEKALEISRDNNFEATEAMSYKHLAEIYLKKNDIKRSEEYFSKSSEIFSKLNLDNNYCSVLINLGSIYDSQKKINKAISTTYKAYLLAQQSNYPSEKKASTELLGNLYYKTKDFEKAFYFQSIAKKIGDSLFYDENKNITLKAEFKYETEKKEAQIKTLSKDKKIATLESEKQKTIALVLGVLIVSLVLISYFLFNKYKIKKQNELLKSQLDEAQKTIEAEKKATESELKALKSQMNPHFIFNALSGIQDQFMYGDKAIANEQMGNFTYLTRQILTVSGKKQILIATEIEILTKYLELEKMRFKTDFEYQINCNGNIDEDYHEIPPMLIQPFVENSIKHGLLHKNGLKKVSINFELSESEEYIICTIEDNGIGRKKSAEIKARNQNHHQSFSTESIAQRLEIWNNNTLNSIIYEDVLDLNTEIIGTKVILNIEIH
jgi:two-component system LytT family sensor kinase